MKNKWLSVMYNFLENSCNCDLTSSWPININHMFGKDFQSFLYANKIASLNKTKINEKEKVIRNIQFFVVDSWGSPVLLKIKYEAFHMMICSPCL